MSATRLVSKTGQATDMTQRNAIIIALGQPSDPTPHDATMHAMAKAVAKLLPGWTIRGATLESPGSVATAAEGLGAPLVYPLFLANGYFMANVLPKRLARLVPGATILPPLGADAAFRPLVVATLATAAREAGYEHEHTNVLLAAHGSEMFPASRLSSQQLASDVASQTAFKSVTVGFIEEHPFIEEAARGLAQAICLPLFALSASHAAIDVPTALVGASFQGLILPPIGMHPDVPALIAHALVEQAQKVAA